VAGFTLSRLAETDLEGVAEYTLQRWGEAQAEKYLSEMETCCRMLASNPQLGRACDDIRPGLRRIERGEHIVFYRIIAAEVFVIRILHRAMLPQRDAIDQKE
jgi:toxin ParE1/3/4